MCGSLSGNYQGRQQSGQRHYITMRSTRLFYRLLTALLFVLNGAQVSNAANSAGAPKFGERWKALIGESKGENQAGSGSGVCGFHFDLAEHVSVRTNHAELSAGAPAHDDLMVLSPEAAPDKAKAVYYDNEGHVIEYSAEWSADGNTLTFSSKAGP